MLRIELLIFGLINKYRSILLLHSLQRFLLDCCFKLWFLFFFAWLNCLSGYFGMGVEFSRHILVDLETHLLPLHRLSIFNFLFLLLVLSVSLFVAFVFCHVDCQHVIAAPSAVSLVRFFDLILSLLNRLNLTTTVSSLLLNLYWLYLFSLRIILDSFFIFDFHQFLESESALVVGH